MTDHMKPLIRTGWPLNPPMVWARWDIERVPAAQATREAAAVLDGCGVGATHCAIGDANPAAERCAPFTPLPTLPVWLTAPAALRRNPRVLRVRDHLAGAF